MEYRTLAGLRAAIVRGSRVLPADIDLIVGVPRSGLLAASLLALHRNLPLTDVDGLLEGRILASGPRGRATSLATLSQARRVLVVDDSLCGGAAMANVRARLAQSAVADRVLYAAVFVAPGMESSLDFAFEICATPRFFEWNFMHHSCLGEACVDIDGVLCRDPSPEENDDGPRYREFLATVAPNHVPTVEIGALATCRLEKYRRDTVDWLRRNGIRYRALYMMDLPSKEARIRSGSHARFKAIVYRAASAQLFIESSEAQALRIADLAQQPVFCVESGATIFPSPISLASGALRKAPRVLARRTAFARTAVGGWLLKRVSY